MKKDDTRRDARAVAPGTRRRLSSTTGALTRLLLTCSICLTLGACAGLTASQKSATLKFASAATELGDAASSELTKIHDQTVAMNIAMYGLPDVSGIATPVVVTEINNSEYENLAGRFSGQWYDVFASGPPALKAYGQALTDILNADNTTQVKQSSDSLAAALAAIPKSPVSSATQSTISSLTQQLTELVLAKMKAHAIRSIVSAYNADIETVCNVIGRQFVIVPDGQHQPDNFAADFRAVAQTLSVSSQTAMTSYPTDRHVRSDGLASWLVATGNLNEVKTIFPQIVKSSSECKSANAALLKALSSDAVDAADIESFYAGGKQLYSTVEALDSKK
jgi:hypothetical protein